MGIPQLILGQLSDVHCVLCREEKENRTELLCNNCSPFNYGENKEPHQRIRLTKQWKVNAEKKKDEMNRICEGCGNKPESGLTPHHFNPINYKKVWYNLLNKYLREQLENNVVWSKEWDETCHDDSVHAMQVKTKVKEEIHKLQRSSIVKACPFCNGSQLSTRKIKKPMYYCSNCHKEFDKVKLRSDKKFSIHPEQIESIAKELIFNGFFKRIILKFYDKMKEEFDHKIERKVQKYLNMKDTVVLCKRCHYAAEKDMILCPICKKNYYFITYGACYECSKKADEGKISSISHFSL